MNLGVVVSNIRALYAGNGEVLKANSPTWVMWDLMATISDSDLAELDFDIVDASEFVLKHIEGKRY